MLSLYCRGVRKGKTPSQNSLPLYGQRKEFEDKRSLDVSEPKHNLYFTLLQYSIYLTKYNEDTSMVDVTLC
jgi:hypothetical protein